MRITTTAILALTTSFGFAKKQEDIVSLRHYRRQNLPSDGGRSLKEEENPFFAKNDGIKKAKKEQQHQRYRKSQSPTAGGDVGLFTTPNDAAVLEENGGENTDINTNTRGVVPLTNGGEKKENTQSLEWVSTHHDKYKITNHVFAKEEHEEAPGADIGILRAKPMTNGSTTAPYSDTTNEKKHEEEQADIGILSTTTTGRGRTRMLAPVTCASEGDTSCDATTFTEPCEKLGTKVYITSGSCNFDYACDGVAGGTSYDTTVVITCSSCNEYFACDSVARFGYNDGASTVTIENESCNEPYACASLGSSAEANTSFTISGSCNGGDYACRGVGRNAGEGAQFKVEGSCNAELACYYLGAATGTGTTFEITGGSCSGAKKTCLYLGYKAKDDVTFKIANASCYGSYSCQYLGYKIYGNSAITVDNGSCNGNKACRGALAYADGAPAILTIDNGSCTNFFACANIGYYAEGGGTFTIDKGSCNGTSACASIGYHAEGGTFTIDEGSCNGASACEDIGYYAEDATFTITSNSCTDQEACYRMGYKPAGAGAEFTVSDGSCTGKQACAYLGQYAAENAMFNIASTACIGYKACYYLGAFSSEVSVGEGSCNVAGACTSTKSGDPGSTDSIVIGANSCTCEGCCTDLQPGSIVGDCQCNDGDCAGQLVNRPGECPTLSSSCASQAGAVPCGFSDDPTVQFTSFCELHDGKHFHNNCRRHQVDDEISLLGPGDAIEKDRIIASCGCCDENALKEVAEYKKIANDIKEEDAAFCSEPICTPEDSSWEICSGGSKKASKKSKSSKASKGKSSGKGKSESDIKIKFCKNGKTECRDPFHKFSSKDTVMCGSCP